jgi:putative tryptophan/tyrosine transport system substrate-binding protein
MRRRTFIAGLGSAVAWPVVAWAQQPGVPVIEFVHGGLSEPIAREMAAFLKGLSETGYVEGRNVTVEPHFMAGQYDRLPALMADSARRRVAVIVAVGGPAAIAAKDTSATIPIVFALGEDPVKIGLVASLPRPGGNATGFNFFAGEVTGKRLMLLHQMMPKAARVAVLVNPLNSGPAERTLREVQEAARTNALQIQVLNASLRAHPEGPAFLSGHARPRRRQPSLNRADGMLARLPRSRLCPERRNGGSR